MAKGARDAIEHVQRMTFVIGIFEPGNSGLTRADQSG